MGVAKTRKAGPDKQKARAGHGPAARRASDSLSGFRAARAVDALTRDFVRWYEEDLGPADDAMACLEVVKSVAAVYFEATGAVEATAFAPGPLAMLLEDLETAGEEEAVELVVEMFHFYVDFLKETGRWSGTDQDYEAVHALLVTSDLSALAPSRIEVPAFQAAEETAALAALPLVRAARALLAWIGSGRPVTPDGRLEEIEAAAAMPEPVTEQAMERGQLLDLIWSTLRTTEQIDIGPDTAVVHEEAPANLGKDHPEELEELRLFVSMFLERGVLEAGPGGPGEVLSAELVLGVFIAAASPEPPLVERFLSAAAHAPEAEQAVVEAATHDAYRRLQAWAALGLLDIDTHFHVPPAVIRCVAEAFEDDVDLDIVWPDAEGEAVSR